MSDTSVVLEIPDPHLIIELDKQTFVKEAFINKKPFSTFIFYLKKAFDTTLKHGILKDIHEPCLRKSTNIYLKFS